jgi:hypothetical protein
MIAGSLQPVAARRHAVESGRGLRLSRLGPKWLASVNVRRSLRSNLLRAGRPSHQKVVPLRPECPELILQLRHLG